MWYQIHKADYCLKHLKLVFISQRKEIYQISLSRYSQSTKAGLFQIWQMEHSAESPIPGLWIHLIRKKALAFINCSVS